MAFSRARLALNSLFPRREEDNSANWRAVQQWEWDMPWGVLGYVEITANQTGIGTTLTDVTGLTLTFQAYTNRRYRITGKCHLRQNTAAGSPELDIVTSGGTVVQNDFGSLSTAAYIRPAEPIVIVTSAAGSVTYKLQAKTDANTCDVICSSTNPAFLLVEDIGPYGPQ